MSNEHEFDKDRPEHEDNAPDNKIDNSKREAFGYIEKLQDAVLPEFIEQLVDDEEPQELEPSDESEQVADLTAEDGVTAEDIIPEAEEVEAEHDFPRVIEAGPEPEPPSDDEFLVPLDRPEEVIGVSFRRGGKVYYFHPNGVVARPGQQVLARTERGVDIGEVVMRKKWATPEELDKPLKPLVRLATAEDMEREDKLREQEREVSAICQEKIQAHGLPMKLIEADYTFDGQRLTFFFSAEGRVDFRALVRDLAETFHCRIELRQIGVRDEAKMIGGLGPCGRPLCCAQWLRNFDPVGIRVAKDQGMPLNPAKISGICDRLMCCLKYEHEVYRDLAQRLPQVNDEIRGQGRTGRVKTVILLKESVVVEFIDGENRELLEIKSVDLRRNRGYWLMLSSATKPADTPAPMSDMDAYFAPATPAERESERVRTANSGRKERDNSERPERTVRPERTERPERPERTDRRRREEPVAQPGTPPAGQGAESDLSRPRRERRERLVSAEPTPREQPSRSPRGRERTYAEFVSFEDMVDQDTVTPVSETAAPASTPQQPQAEAQHESANRTSNRRRKRPRITPGHIKPHGEKPSGDAAAVAGDKSADAAKSEDKTEGGNSQASRRRRRPRTAGERLATEGQGQTNNNSPVTPSPGEAQPGADAEGSSTTKRRRYRRPRGRKPDGNVT